MFLYKAYHPWWFLFVFESSSISKGGSPNLRQQSFICRNSFDQTSVSKFHLSTANGSPTFPWTKKGWSDVPFLDYTHPSWAQDPPNPRPKAPWPNQHWPPGAWHADVLDNPWCRFASKIDQPTKPHTSLRSTKSTGLNPTNLPPTKKKLEKPQPIRRLRHKEQRLPESWSRWGRHVHSSSVTVLEIMSHASFFMMGKLCKRCDHQDHLSVRELPPRPPAVYCRAKAMAWVLWKGSLVGFQKMFTT